MDSFDDVEDDMYEESLRDKGALLHHFESDDGDYLEVVSKPKDLSVCSMLLLNVGWVGVSAMLSAWGIVIVPSQARATVGAQDEDTALGVIIGAGALVTVIFTPFMGMISDRSTLSWGKRRPYIAIGAILLALFSILLGITNPTKPPADQGCNGQSFDLHGNLAVLILVYSLAIFGNQLFATAYNGLIADRTPEHQRGLSSGIIGAMVVLGDILGAGSGMLYDNLTILQILGILSGVVLLVSFIVVVSQPELVPAPVPARGPSCKAIFKDYVQPFKSHDFTWVFVTRFLMQQGLGTVMFFLQYYFQDLIPLPTGVRAEEAVSYALIPLLVMATISSAIAGKLSDHFGGRRRVFVITSAVTMMTVVIILMFIRSFWQTLFMSAIFGLGYGVFVAVDFAMVLDVLPDEKSRAKDLAVWHLAMVLPQLIATPIGSLVLHEVSRAACDTYDGSCGAAHCSYAYITLFAITALYFFLSAVFVFRIRNVK